MGRAGSGNGLGRSLEGSPESSVLGSCVLVSCVGGGLRQARCLRPGEKERRRSRKVPDGKTRIERLRKWGARKGVDMQGDLRLSPEKLP